MKPEGSMLALVTEAYGGAGGIARYNRDFFAAATETGSVSTIVILPRTASESVRPPERIRQLAPRYNRLGYSLQAMRLAASRRFSHVFCGHLHMAALAAMLARGTGMKLIVQAHGIEAWHKPGRLVRWGVEAADLVLCVSRYTRGKLLDWAAIDPERALVLPNTVGDNFRPGDASALRARLGLTGKLVLLTVARMDSRERYKGHDRVIALLPRLLAEGHDVAYLVVGEGSDLGRLKGLAADLGVADRVHFVGPSASTDLPDYYRLADLFLMPSTGEGFGIAFIESMAAGTPALGLGVGGANDALAGGDLGVAVSEAGFSDAVVHFLGKARRASNELSAATHARFGRGPFSANVRMAMQRVSQAAPRLSSPTP